MRSRHRHLIHALNMRFMILAENVNMRQEKKTSNASRRLKIGFNNLFSLSYENRCKTARGDYFHKIKLYGGIANPV